MFHIPGTCIVFSVFITALKIETIVSCILQVMGLRLWGGDTCPKSHCWEVTEQGLRQTWTSGVPVEGTSPRELSTASKLVVLNHR